MAHLVSTSVPRDLAVWIVYLAEANNQTRSWALRTIIEYAKAMADEHGELIGSKDLIGRDVRVPVPE